MSKNKRREFIKWSVLSGLTAKTTLSTFGQNSNFPNSDVWESNPKKYWQSIRDEFYLNKERIYFNTAGIGSSPKRVSQKLIDLTIELDQQGETGHHHTKDPHQKIAEFLNADIEEIAITRNSTEGINIVARSLPLKKGDEVIISTHEHVGGAAPWLMLQNELGIKLKLINLDLSGEGNFDLVKNAISKNTKVICISHVTCTTGMVLPMTDIVEYCRSQDIFTCIDGAQAVGMIHVDLKNIAPDFYITSGHKWLYGPKGTGILYINKNSIKKIKPLFAGAYSNTLYDLNKKEFAFKMEANRVEYGTRNSAEIVAFGEAITFINEIGLDKIIEKGNGLANQLKEGLSQNGQIEILSPFKEKYSSSIVTFRHKEINYLELQKILNLEFNIRVRGIYENELNAIRISCAIYNSEDEIKALLYALKEINKND